MEEFLIAALVPALATTFRLAAVLQLAALGENFVERSGILSIGLEGYMLTAAFAAFLGSLFTGSALIGVLFGMLGGLLMSLVHGFLSIKLAVNQLGSGIGINIFALGLTGFLSRDIATRYPASTSVAGLESIDIPVLSQLPIIGPIIFQHQPLVYVALIGTPICSFILFKTMAGLRVRAVGENPLAAESAGLSVQRIRYLCIIFGGLMAGLAGSSFALGIMKGFVEGYTAGYGFIALAIIILGSWNPLKILGGAILFGGTFAAQIQIQLLWSGYISVYPFLMMMPYVLAVVILAGVVGRVQVPQALCIPFKRKK